MIPFTTCLRLNRKRHKETREEGALSTATDDELLVKPTTSSSTPSDGDDGREVQESLEARRCAWRLMEERMAEPGAKKLISSPIPSKVHPSSSTSAAEATTTVAEASASTISTLRGRPSIQVDVDIHCSDSEEGKAKVTTETADCSMRALMLMKMDRATDEMATDDVASCTLSVYGRRRSSSSIRFADDTDTGTDILIITEEDLAEILCDPVYGGYSPPPGGRDKYSSSAIGARRLSSHSLLSEDAYAIVPSTVAQHGRFTRNRRSLISPSVHKHLVQSKGVFGMSLGGAGSVAYDGQGKTQSTRLLVTLRRRKSLSRSIHIDPVALLDLSYSKVVNRLLHSCSSWKFSSFTLDTLTGGHSLPAILVHLFNEYRLIQHFQLDMLSLVKCFHLFEQGYHDTNPYHNSVHAADVTQAMHCFIREKKIGPYLGPMEKMCAILAAVTHDLDHPGVNQHFLIATNSHLASLYNNISVLESHHWRFAISCIKESQVFNHFSREQWAQIRHLLKSLILATDITQQAGYLIHFRKCLQSTTGTSSSPAAATGDHDTTPRPVMWQVACTSSSSSSSSSSSAATMPYTSTFTPLPEPSSGLSMSLPENRLFILKIALKCADLANPCRTWQHSRRWTEQICSEFYRQGDYERQLNLPITPIFNRFEASMAKIQTDFFQNVVTPLFELWDQFLDSQLSRQLIANLNFNYNQWLSFQNKKMITRRHSMISSVSPDSTMITIAKRNVSKATTTATDTETVTPSSSRLSSSSTSSSSSECSFSFNKASSSHRSSLIRSKSLASLSTLQAGCSLSEAQCRAQPGDTAGSLLPASPDDHAVAITTSVTALSSQVASPPPTSHRPAQLQRQIAPLNVTSSYPVDNDGDDEGGDDEEADDDDDESHRQFQCDGIHGCGTPSSLGSPRSEDFSDPSSIASGSADDVDIDPLSQRHPLTSHVSEEDDYSSPDEEALDHLVDHPPAVHNLPSGTIPSTLSAGIALHSSHPLSPLSAQMFLDRGQYLGGRRGSAPGCIGVYASAELAAAALAFLQGALTNTSTVSSGVPRRSSAPVEAGQRNSFSGHHHFYGHHYHSHHNQNNRKNSNNSNRSHRSDETHNAVNRQKAMGWTNPYGQGKRGRSMEVLTVSQSTAEA